MDQVLAKTMDTIKGKMGGQILTLEDVRDNQALAGQFQKQLSYMTDVAHIAKSQSEAEQLSKAWQTGKQKPQKILVKKRWIPLLPEEVRNKREQTQSS
jgi:hypothetical protein